MTQLGQNLLTTKPDRAPGRRPVSWDGGAAMVVDEDAAFGAFSTIPSEHYIQIALGTGGGRHVCGWNGRHVFDGNYRDGLMSVTPAGHTLHGECQASWRKALIVKVKPRFVSQVAKGMGFAREDIIPAIDQTDNMMLQLARAVAAECEAGVPHGTLYAETAATLLSLHLLRQNAGTALVRPQPVRGGLAPYVLRRVTELIEARLGEDISLSDLAAAEPFLPRV
jgi:AraC family transcriptional regulator